MRKTIFVSLLFLASHATFAKEQTVVAQLHLTMVGGSPMFSTFWKEENKVGFVQMGLVWSAFDPTVHGHGFKFTNGPVIAISPVLSENCRIKSVKGSFNYVGGSSGPNNPLAINLDGDCAGYIAELEKNDIHLNFKNVPSLDDLTVTPDLDVVISH